MAQWRWLKTLNWVDSLSLVTWTGSEWKEDHRWFSSVWMANGFMSQHRCTVCGTISSTLISPSKNNWNALHNQFIIWYTCMIFDMIYERWEMRDERCEMLWDVRCYEMLWDVKRCVTLWYVMMWCDMLRCDISPAYSDAWLRPNLSCGNKVLS